MIGSTVSKIGYQSVDPLGLKSGKIENFIFNSFYPKEYGVVWGILKQKNNFGLRSHHADCRNIQIQIVLFPKK